MGREPGANGGKGSYGLEDDWSEGYSGYAFGYEGTTLVSLAQEAMKEWQTPHPKKTFKPAHPTIRSGGSRECSGGCCSKLSTGRFDALTKDAEICDLDLPMMMFQDAGDVPVGPSSKPPSVIPGPLPVPEYSTLV